MPAKAFTAQGSAAHVSELLDVVTGSRHDVMCLEVWLSGRLFVGPRQDRQWSRHHARLLPRRKAAQHRQEPPYRSPYSHSQRPSETCQQTLMEQHGVAFFHQQEPSQIEGLPDALPLGGVEGQQKPSRNKGLLHACPASGCCTPSTCFLGGCFAGPRKDRQRSRRHVRWSQPGLSSMDPGDTETNVGGSCPKKLGAAAGSHLGAASQFWSGSGGETRAVSGSAVDLGAAVPELVWERLQTRTVRIPKLYLIKGT